jgi:cyclase
MKTKLTAIILLSCFAEMAAAQDTQTPKIEKLTSRVSVITAGFNGAITVFQSDAGPVIVDTADAASAPAVQAAIRQIDPRPPAAVILTHYHGDHLGGLETLAAGAPLHAHENCFASYRRRDPHADQALSKAGELVPYSAHTEIRLGGDIIRLIHPGNAHTAGDTVVVFEKERVMAAGDLFFNGVPPYIDVEDGADTQAWADMIDRVSKQYSGFTVVAGHGPISDTDGWKKLATYLRALRKGVADAVAAGQTREQAQESVNLEQFTWITDMGEFLTKKANIGWVYDELTKKR